MKTLARYFLTVLVIAWGVALWAPSPGASSEHFVLVNDNNYQGNNEGTELKLLGSPANFSLQSKGTFSTGGVSKVFPYAPNIQMIQHGPDTCAFLSDGQSMDIASFLYPSLVKVGNYTDSDVTNSRLGILLAARGNYLFAAYNGQTSQDGQIGVWQIEQGCTLSLISTYTAAYAAREMDVTPNGKALVISYDTDFYVGSYGIGSGGVLTGPYMGYITQNGYAPWGLDITADSKYAIFDAQSDYTALDIFPINSDGSLGLNYQFGGYGTLGNAKGGGEIRLSPNQTFLFVGDSIENITTLNFTEVPVKVTYGCMTTLRVPNDEPSVSAWRMATALPSTAGVVLYVAEFANFSHVATLDIDPSTGCATEGASSPFQLTDNNADAGSLVAWPPRPF